MTNPVLSEIGAVFVPVRDIELARDWYCRLLDLKAPEVLFGHLCVIPMQEGIGLVLDSKDFAGPVTGKPLFHFNTRDIAAARRHLEGIGVAAIGPVTDGVFFTFDDVDGNRLMMADVPPATRSA